MVKITSIVLALILVTGCSTRIEKQYIDRPVLVEIPVTVKPEIPKINRPYFPINNLKKDSTAKEIAEAYYKTIILYKRYTQELEKALEPFWKEEK